MSCTDRGQGGRAVYSDCGQSDRFHWRIKANGAGSVSTRGSAGGAPNARVVQDYGAPQIHPRSRFGTCAHTDVRPESGEGGCGFEQCDHAAPYPTHGERERWGAPSPGGAAAEAGYEPRGYEASCPLCDRIWTGEGRWWIGGRGSAHTYNGGWACAGWTCAVGDC